MALEHALLVSLMERAGSGYELAQRFQKSIGYFWHASHQQIYRVLKRMDEAGWVTGEAVPQDGRPDKTVYRVSESGKAELASWISTPSPVVDPRSEFAVKLRGASYGDIDALLIEIRAHRDELDRRLDLFRRMEKRQFPSPTELRGDALHQYLVLRGGIRAHESYIDWCTEILDTLAARSATDRAPSSPARSRDARAARKESPDR